MKISLNNDSILTIWEDQDNSSEEFNPKGTILDVDFVDINSTFSGKLKFAQFQFGDGSVCSIPLDEFAVLESCEHYETSIKE